MINILKKCGVQWLYYFFLLDNLISIIENGILPKNIVDNQIGASKSFANEEVQGKRHTRKIKLSSGNLVTIHDVVPLYFTPLTPTLSAVREQKNEICFAVVSGALKLPQTWRDESVGFYSASSSSNILDL